MMDCLIGVAHDWQTLIAGLIAIVAAFIGGYYINKQIRQTETIELDRQSREFAAARAMLPLHLDALVEHLLRCGEVLKSLYMLESVAAPNRANVLSGLPPVPMDIATFLQSVILRSPSALRAPFVEILSELQVFHARLSSLKARMSRGNAATYVELDDYILQAMDLHARCLSLLPFARNQSEDAPTRAAVAGHYLTSLSIMGFDSDNYATLTQKAAQMVVSAASPAT